ncbi:MAG: M23 family metallopeptidase, partial [Mycobacteriales bacterium]
MRRSALLLSLVLTVAIASAASALVDPGSGTTYEMDQVVVPMTFPVLGPTSYSDNFLVCRSGCARMHMGQDLMGPKMSPLVAAFDGVVTSLKLDGSSGNYVAITADSGRAAGWTALYLHVNNDNPGTDDGNGSPAWAFPAGIALGSRVLAGQLIGWRGDSGNAESTGSHLHFELRKGWGWSGTVYNAYPSLRAARRLSRPLPSGPHPSGTLVRHPNGVLFVLDGGLKRPVSPTVLAANRMSPASAVPMTAAESMTYGTLSPLTLRDGAVVRDDAGQLWLVTGGQRIAVTSTDLAALHRTNPRVFPVTGADLAQLPLGETVPTTPYYPGALVRTDGTPEVRWVDAAGVLRPVDGATLVSYGWGHSDVTVVPASGPSYGDPLPMRDGTLVQTRAPVVGVISGGAFRRIYDSRMVR